MKRSEHTFQFTGLQIAKAAQAELEYHNMRLNYWGAAQDEAITAARASGVEVREHEVTGGKNVQIVIDPTVQSRLNECSAKINTHRASADRFQIEAAAYGTQPERTYELHPDDVVYFRLAGGPRQNT